MTTPAECFPVGDFIQEELTARGWTTADLAARMGDTAESRAIWELTVDLLIACSDDRIKMERLLDAPIPHIALENPVSIISSRIRKPDQILQPWQFGHGEVKATCLWLKNLPKLTPTNIVDGRHPACWLASPGPDRWKLRSRTYEGIAKAMAEQWGEAVALSYSV